MERVLTALDHARVREMFAPLVDAELCEREAALLRSHLSGCAECQRGLERYERAVELVRGAGRTRAPRGFAAQVMKRVRRRRALRGSQGAGFFDHVSLPAEAAIPIVLAAIVAAIVLFAMP